MTGPRAAFIGDESGVFEAWIWPLKIGREFTLGFRSDGRPHAFSAKDVARTFTRTPVTVTVRYTHEDFTVDATFFADAVERRLFMVLDVRTKAALEIRWSFIPDYFPMWPAGFGGQIVRKDATTGALLLAEELGRFAALIGSPDLSGDVRLDRGLPKDPIALTFTVTPERARRGPIFATIVGAENAHAALAEGAVVGQAAAATGTARLEKAIAAARALYTQTLAESASAWIDHRFRAADDQTPLARIRASDPRLEGAIDDAAWAIKNAAVEIDGLGRGLVAGIAPSGGGYRPGFAWFFDGDAMIAGDAMLLLGDKKTAREVLARAASHQRADGKLMHELTLSANICRWFTDYPYAYYKCENTSAFLVYLDRYVRVTGDMSFAETLADTADAAAAWIIAQIDDQGFFSLLTAGLGAVEAGPLQKDLASEIYSQGFAIAALSAYLHLDFTDAEYEAEAQAALERLETAFEKFWCAPDDRYGFARTTDGRITNDLSAYLGLPLALFAGTPERRAKTIMQVNRPEVSADWGARMFSVRSPIYDPAHYNTGSVFPYLNGFVITSMYASGFHAGAHQSFDALLGLANLEADGFIPEHLVGDRCVTPERGVPHQIFSSSEIIHATIYGLFGFYWDTAEDFLTFRPSLPLGWTFAEIEDLPVGRSRLNVRIERTRTERKTTRWTIRLDAHDEKTGSPATIGVDIRPGVPLGSRPSTSGTSDDAFQITRESLAMRIVPAWKKTSGRRTFEAEIVEGPTLEVPSAPLLLGESSVRPRIVGIAETDEEITFTVAGRSGRRERLNKWSDRRVEWRGIAVEGPDFLEVDFPENHESDRIERRIVARFI